MEILDLTLSIGTNSLKSSVLAACNICLLKQIKQLFK